MRFKNHDLRFDNIHHWPSSVKKSVLVLIVVLVMLLGLLFESSLFSSTKTAHQQTTNLNETLVLKKNASEQAKKDLQQLAILQKQETNLLS